MMAFWALMFVGAFLILTQRGFSDGDDAYFYQHTNAMGLLPYLRWRYETWVGRMTAEALVWVTFRLGLWFWRVVNAGMLVMIPLGLLTLAGKVTGIPAREVCQNPGASLTAVSGYLLMGAMTLGYAAVWVNGSIFYTWSFACGIWAMIPLAECVFSGEGKKRSFWYSIPCAVIAAMSIEQMGAVLLTFEVLGAGYCLWKRHRVEPLLVVQTVLTLAAFVMLFAAPGNAIRVAMEIETWMPEYEMLTFGEHFFITVQWLLSSFANENKLFLCGIWVAGILLLSQKKQGGGEKVLTLAATVFTVAAMLPFAGVTLLSDMGMGAQDITKRIDRVPVFADMTAGNIAAMLWWTAALIFTVFFLWKVSDGSPTLLLAYLAGIASEAIMFFSPTIYASGARVYYLTDLLYLFVILALSFRMEKKRQNGFYAGTVLFGVINFVVQLPVFLAQI